MATTFPAALQSAATFPGGPQRVAEVGARLKISTEKIPDSQVVMTIEVEAERLDKARDKAVRKLSPKAKVPGFRPGKAPPAMVRRYFGEERILDEALDDLVPDLYREAIEHDESIVPIARPQLVVETTEPLVVKATIPVRPTIELGDYKSVRVKTEDVSVEESRVEDTLVALQRRASTLEPVDREVGWRDVVRIDVRATVDGETLIEPQEAEVQLVEDRDILFEGFEEAVLGKKKGDEVEFDLAVPESLPNEKFAGTTAHFTVKMLETKEEVLPALDEEFTKAVGEGYESIDALRVRIREDIERVEQEQITNRYHDEILGELTERATIEYPPVMVEAEAERLLHDQAGRVEHGPEMDRYLASIGKTEEEVREELRPIAETRLRRSLVLSQVAEAEHIEASDTDIDAEIEAMTASAGPQGEQLRQLFDSENGRDTIRRNLVTRKTLERLVEIATQDGASAAPTAEQEQPAAKKRTRKPKSKAATPAKAGAEAPAETKEVPGE
ncbi:MAG: trigger factor [Dehalococcoidia bacterium]